MPSVELIESIRNKYRAIVLDLDERGRRRWSAAEARSQGWGGITAVAEATGISDRTIRNGILEIENFQTLASDRQRRQGAGRKSREQEQTDLIDVLNELIEPSSRGDPESLLRWTCKSTRSLADELRFQGYAVSASTVRKLLKKSGYSLQSNRKTLEGKKHPDRNAQFEYINKRVRVKKQRGEPAISVDTKKKETLGNLKNPGKIYRSKGNPRKVKTHDFPDPKLGKAIPYGIYDLQYNEAGVLVGITHDTAAFAVAAIYQWWKKIGKKRYHKPSRMLITADSGGSNSSRSRLWKIELQRLVDKTGMIIEVCHFPPGTSKWNKIEHRLFCHISRNWRGVPLETHEVVVSLIGSTTTTQGLVVHAWLDKNMYPRGTKVTDQELDQCNIKRNKFHGDWNYEIHPRKKIKYR